MTANQTPPIGGRYRLERLLGRGGMAAVHAAVDTQLARPVAVKVMRADLGDDPVFQGRFVNEARNAASISHPNVVTVFDFGTDEAGPYIVMELVEGGDLAGVIAREAPLAPHRAAAVASEVAAALDAAHARGIVHRDVKPGNILIAADGHPRVADFGIARATGEQSLTNTGASLGSVDYFSPEQARGDAATAASDIYALGVVLYEMLTGRRPFRGESPYAIAVARVDSPAPDARDASPDVPAELADIARRAMATAPIDRFTSASDMARELQAWMAANPLPEEVPALPPVAPVVPIPAVEASTVGAARVASRDEVETTPLSRAGRRAKRAPAAGAAPAAGVAAVAAASASGIPQGPASGVSNAVPTAPESPAHQAPADDAHAAEPVAAQAAAGQPSAEELPDTEPVAAHARVEEPRTEESPPAKPKAVRSRAPRAPRKPAVARKAAVPAALAAAAVTAAPSPSAAAASPVSPVVDNAPAAAPAAPVALPSAEPVASPPPSRADADRDSRSRRPAPLALAAAAVFLLAVAGFIGGRMLGGAGNEGTGVIVGTPRGAVFGATTEPAPSATIEPTERPTVEPTPTPTLEATPEPSTEPTVAATPAPVAAATPAPAAAAPAPARPRATPAPTPRAVAMAVRPDQTVATWYRYVTDGAFDAAYSMWSQRMKANFPRQGNLDNRWRDTARIEILQLYVAEQSANSAAVQIEFIEYKENGSSRRFYGYWELVRSGDGWLLDWPHF